MSQQAYASIRTFLRGRFRPLESPETHAIAPQGGFASSVVRDEFLNNATLPETVSRFLAQMDRKLDALLAAHNEINLARDFPHPMEVRELSAAGLEIKTDLPLAPNDYLEVYFQISHPFFSVVSGIGTILHRKETPDGAVFAFAFTRLGEHEREQIIRFVFHEERKVLRQRLDA
jgi:hypothetical protein